MGPGLPRQVKRAGPAQWIGGSPCGWFVSARGLVIGAIAAVVLVAATFGAVAVRGPGTADGALPAPRFVEEAETASLTHRYDGEVEFFVGGGVAVLDCDTDGKPDLYLAGGELPAALYRNQSPANGTLAFDTVTDSETALTRVTGAYPLDVDSDRVADLAVLRHGENVLLRGLGDCRFERANEAWGFDGGDAWTTAFSATWEGTAAWPTIALGNYVNEASTDPDRLCHDNELIRPAASEAGFGPLQALSPGWCSLSMLFSDWDRSGRRDLRVSNDRHYYPDADGEEQLWRMEAGEPSRLYTGDDGWQTVKVWGMGIAAADLTTDGYPEYYLTSQGDNKLQVLADGPAQPRYIDIALESGVTAHRPYVGDTRQLSTAWHAEFDDVNNDSFLDLFVSKGNVEAMPEYAADDPSNLLLGQPDGTFVEGAEAAGIVSYARARGAAVVDLNLDGLLDLVVVNRRENVMVWRNLGSGTGSSTEPMGHWLGIRPEQDGANPDAIGSWVEVRFGNRTASRELSVGGGHVSGELGWIHVGLGTHDRAEVRVIWPDGETGPWLPVAANQFVVVERGAAAVRRGPPDGD